MKQHESRDAKVLCQIIRLHVYMAKFMSEIIPLSWRREACSRFKRKPNISFQSNPIQMKNLLKDDNLKNG